MFPAAVLAFVLHQDTVTMRFHPTVGEKIRYKWEITDTEGRSLLPEGSKAFQICKVAGFRDGKYTVHQSNEIISSDGTVNTSLFATFKVDEFYTSELIYSAMPDEMNKAGAEMAAELSGCWGILFPTRALANNESWKLPFDAIATAKKSLGSLLDEYEYKIEGKGDRTFSVSNVDEKSVTFKTQVSLNCDIEPDTTPKQERIAFKYEFGQTGSFDRTSGMPINLDRNFNVVVKQGVTSQVFNGLVKLTREK